VLIWNGTGFSYDLCVRAFLRSVWDEPRRVQHGQDPHRQLMAKLGARNRVKIAMRAYETNRHNRSGPGSARR
jgi:hypothetical protein